MQRDTGSRRVLDASALMALLNGEPGAEAVSGILGRATAGEGTVALPFMALMEVEYQLRRRWPLSRVQRIMGQIGAWPADVYESTPEWRSEAAKLKAGGRISVADAWIASLALVLDAELVHKDPEFDSISGLRSLRLPDVEA